MKVTGNLGAGDPRLGEAGLGHLRTGIFAHDAFQARAEKDPQVPGKPSAGARLGLGTKGDQYGG